MVTSQPQPSTDSSPFAVWKAFRLALVLVGGVALVGAASRGWLGDAVQHSVARTWQAAIEWCADHPLLAALLALVVVGPLPAVIRLLLAVVRRVRAHLRGALARPKTAPFPYPTFQPPEWARTPDGDNHVGLLACGRLSNRQWWVVKAMVALVDPSAYLRVLELPGKSQPRPEESEPFRSPSEAPVLYCVGRGGDA